MSDHDNRRYVPDSADWTAEIMRSGEKTYCHHRFPGEDYYHLLVEGELHLQRGNERCCLSCAIRLGHLTENRMQWQNRERRPRQKLV